MIDHLTTVRGIAEAITAIGIAIGTVWGGLLYLPKLWAWFMRGLSRTRTIWTGLEAIAEHKETLAAIPGSLDALRAQGEERGAQLAEHGAMITGVRQELRAATNELTAQGEKLSSVSTKVDSVVNTQRAILNTNTRVAVLDADNRGFINGINKTWTKWTGLDERATFHLSWLNAIKPDQLARFREAWFSAVADCRRFEARVTLVHAALGKEMEVDMVGDPIPEGAVPPERYMINIQQAQVAT